MYMQKHTRIFLQSEQTTLSNSTLKYIHIMTMGSTFARNLSLWNNNFQYSLVNKELNKGIPRVCRDASIKAKAQLKFKVARLVENYKKGSSGTQTNKQEQKENTEGPLKGEMN